VESSKVQAIDVIISIAILTMLRHITLDRVGMYVYMCYQDCFKNRK